MSLCTISKCIKQIEETTSYMKLKCSLNKIKHPFPAWQKYTVFHFSTEVDSSVNNTTCQKNLKCISLCKLQQTCTQGIPSLCTFSNKICKQKLKCISLFKFQIKYVNRNLSASICANFKHVNRQDISVHISNNKREKIKNNKSTSVKFTDFVPGKLTCQHCQVLEMPCGKLQCSHCN